MFNVFYIYKISNDAYIPLIDFMEKLYKIYFSKNKSLNELKKEIE